MATVLLQQAYGAMWHVILNDIFSIFFIGILVCSELPIFASCREILYDNQRYFENNNQGGLIF